MRIKAYFLTGFAALVLLPVSAVAVMAGPSETPSAPGSQRQTQRQGVMQEIKDERAAMQEKTAEMRSAAKGSVQDLRQQMQQRVQDLQVKRQALQEQIKKQREDFMVQAKARREALKKKLGEERAQRIEDFFGQMVGRFENAIDRLNGVADKIDARLASSTANSADIASLRDKLTAARGEITEAQTALTDAKTKYADAAKSPDFRVAFGKVRELVKGVAEKVKDAHRALVEVIAAIKEAGAQGSPAASSTQQ